LCGTNVGRQNERDDREHRLRERDLDDRPACRRSTRHRACGCPNQGGSEQEGRDAERIESVSRAEPKVEVLIVREDRGGAYRFVGAAFELVGGGITAGVEDARVAAAVDEGRGAEDPRKQ
jgi:hypothetical protein